MARARGPCAVAAFAGSEAAELRVQAVEPGAGFRREPEVHVVAAAFAMRRAVAEVDLVVGDEAARAGR